MYGINLGINLLRQSKPLTETDQQQVITEVPRAMAEVLANPDAENPAPQQSEPESVSQPEPGLLTEEQIRANVLTDEQLTEVWRVINQGKDHPGYGNAVERLYAHKEVSYRLSQLRRARLSGTPRHQ